MLSNGACRLAARWPVIQGQANASEGLMMQGMTGPGIRGLGDLC